MLTDGSLTDRFPARATTWRLRSRTLRFGRLPVIMGIVNVTPDSFSDGGRYFSTDAAVDQAVRLAAEGADLLDIGGESTRPFSEPVALQEELDRVLPVVEAVCRATSAPISIDTSKPAVARAAIAAGAEIINDVTGLADSAMVKLAIETGAGVCAMHMQGTPQTMQIAPHYDNVVTEVASFLRERADQLISAGINPERIALDPGIGFGKTHEHNLMLLGNCWQFHQLGRPVFVGHSRKGFIGKVLGNKEADRTFGTVGVSLSLARQGVQVLRVHDVASVREALILFAATGGIDGAVARLE